jgi:hypothetical protein
MSIESDPQPSEQTPLLRASEPEQATPLPKFQIFLLTVTRVAEPLGFAILFPFVNSQVASTGEVAVEEVGYYVGLIESLFSLVETLFCAASDLYLRLVLYSLTSSCPQLSLGEGPRTNSVVNPCSLSHFLAYLHPPSFLASPRRSGK